MPSAASALTRPRSAAAADDVAEQHQQTGGGEREGRRERNHAARRRQRRFERHDDKPDGGERRDAAGQSRDRRDQARQCQRRQHMGALVAPGAREEIGGEDRNDEPGEHDQLDRARRAARSEINRKRGQGDDAAEQARRDEGAMPRRGQRILLRRRMHQRLNIARTGANRPTIPTHARLCRRAPPFLSRIVSDAA